MTQISIPSSVVLIVVLISFYVTASIAQKPSSVLESMDISVRGRNASKNESWKMIQKDVKEKSAHYEWKETKKMVSIIVREAASQSEARDLLNQTMLRIPVPFKTKLAGYGDEAYFYQSDGQEPSTILIIQGNLFIHVRSSHSSSARDFAKDICEIAKSQKTQR